METKLDYFVMVDDWPYDPAITTYGGLNLPLEIVYPSVGLLERSIHRVYIASPYTLGDVAENVRAQLYAAEELREHGFLPHIPLLSHFWHLIIPHEYEYWMKICLEEVTYTDALLRLPGVSRGAEREVARAKELGIPIFHSVKQLLCATTPPPPPLVH